MEALVARIDELEVAAFIDRIALFFTAGCNPRQSLSCCLSSMPDDSPLRLEIMADDGAAKPGQSPAETLRQTAVRLESEALLLVAMGFDAYLKLGVELKEPLARLAEAIRWHHTVPIHSDPKYRQELAVALFSYKMGFLMEIDRPPRDAVRTLAAYDRQLGQELVRVHQDLAAGYTLPEALARGAERTGSRAMKLLSVAVEVGTVTGVPRAAMLRQTADAIRRELSAWSSTSSS